MTDKKSTGNSTRHKSYIPVKTIDLPSFLCPSCIGRGCFSDTEKKNMIQKSL